MKSILKLFAHKVTLLCLYLYFVFIFISQYLADISINLKTWIVPLLCAGAVLAAGITDKICRIILGRNLNQTGTKKEQVLWFLGTFAGALAILSMYYYAFFPGAFSPDSNGQLSQALSGSYSDWHPFVHTFLFFTVPMKLFHAEEMIVFLQLVYFSAGLAYLTATVRKYGCPRWLCALETGFVLLSPVTGNILMYPWKDCGLAVFAMVATAHYINIILSQGVWLRKKRNILACGLFLALTALMRHNAVLFVLPMTAALLVNGWKKYRRGGISVAAVFVMTVLLVKGPVYNVFQVEKPGSRVLESVGMCMTMMGNVVKNCPQLLDEEVRNFLYGVAPREAWEEENLLKGFNTVKFKAGTNKAAIEEAGTGKILDYTFRSFWAAKRLSLQAFFRVTGMVWKLDGNLDWGIGANADTDKTEIVPDAERQAEIRASLKNWGSLMGKSILRFPMNYIGWINLALLALALTGIGRKKAFSGALHAVPMLCYNFGTALLLTGLDWRFFYLTFPLAIPTLFLLAREIQSVEKVQGAGEKKGQAEKKDQTEEKG